MARPNPDPCFVFLDSSPTINGENILLLISFDIPNPLSAIMILYFSFDHYHKNHNNRSILFL